MTPAPLVYLRPRIQVIQPLEPMVKLRTAQFDSAGTEPRSPRAEARLIERVIANRESLLQQFTERRVETRIVEREKLVLRLTERVRTEDARLTAERPPAASTPVATPRTPESPRPPEMKLNRTPEPKEQREPQREQRARPVAARPAAPPIDLNTLTDQVMRQMDRKLQAHRERMWRP